MQVTNNGTVYKVFFHVFMNYQTRLFFIAIYFLFTCLLWHVIQWCTYSFQSKHTYIYRIPLIVYLTTILYNGSLAAIPMAEY